MATRILEAQAIISAVDKTGGTFRQIASNVAKANGDIQSIGRTLMFTGGALTAGVTLPIIGFAKAAADAAITFETDFASVRKVLGKIDAEGVREIRSEIIDLSTEIPLAAAEFARIYEAAGQSGIAVKELEGFARLVAESTVAMGGSTDQMSSDLAKIKTAGNLSLESLSDLTDVVNELSNTSASAAPDLISILQKVGALGQVAGLSMETTAAIGSAMVASGASADVAATAAKNLFLTLSAGGGVTKRQSIAFKTLGLDAIEVSKSLQKDAGGTIREVFHRLSTLPEYKRAAVAMQLFGKESLGAIGPLVSNLELLDAVLELVGDQTRWAGSRAQEFASQSDTAANQIQLFKNNVEALKIELGSEMLPVIKDVTKNASGMLRALRNSFGPETTGQIITAGVALAALGPVLFTLGIGAVAVGKLGGAIGAVVAAAGGLKGVGAIVARFAGRFGPATFLIAGAVKEWEATSESLKQINDGLIKVVSAQGEMLAGILTGDLARVRDGFNQHLDGFAAVVEGGFGLVVAAVKGGFDLIDEAILAWAPPSVAAGWGQLRDSILQAVEDLKADVLPGLQEFSNAFLDWARAMAAGDFQAAASAVGRMVVGGGQAIVDAVTWAATPSDDVKAAASRLAGDLGIVSPTTTADSQIGRDFTLGGDGRFKRVEDGIGDHVQRGLQDLVDTIARSPIRVDGLPSHGSLDPAGWSLLSSQSVRDAAAERPTFAMPYRPSMPSERPTDQTILRIVDSVPFPPIKPAYQPPEPRARPIPLPPYRPGHEPIILPASPAPAPLPPGFVDALRIQASQGPRVHAEQPRVEMDGLWGMISDLAGQIRDAILGAKDGPHDQPTFADIAHEIGTLTAEVTGPIPAEVRGPVTADLKGQANVNVRVQVQGPGRVTGMSAQSQGHIAADVGVGMQDAVPGVP